MDDPALNLNVLLCVACFLFLYQPTYVSNCTQASAAPDPCNTDNREFVLLSAMNMWYSILIVIEY